MNELYHHGIKGQRWGVRRYQNPDGTLTAAGKKKEYKKALKSDKKIRTDLESKIYDSSGIADAYSEKLKSYSKEYEKAIAKDPTKSNPKTQRIENTKVLLESTLKEWDNYNSENIQKLKKHVDSMVNKYSDTKIKDVDIKTTKNGFEYAKSIRANSDATYNLHKRKYDQYNVDVYEPVKTRHYYY